MKLVFSLFAIAFIARLATSIELSQRPTGAGPSPRRLGLLTNDSKEKLVIELSNELTDVENEIAVNKG